MYIAVLPKADGSGRGSNVAFAELDQALCPMNTSCCVVLFSQIIYFKFKRRLRINVNVIHVANQLFQVIMQDRLSV